MRLVTLICAAACFAVAFAQGPWHSSEFPISCWRGPPPSHNTLEHYKVVRDCNFNIVGPTGGYRRETHREMLDLLWRGRGGFIAGFYGDNASIGLEPRWQEIACDEFLRQGVRGAEAGAPA